MKKIGAIIFLLCMIAAIMILGFYHKDNQEPNQYYQVYLDDEVIGTISSKEKLLEYIDKQGKYLKKKYDTDKVYPPNGLQIKKITTYHKKLDSVKTVYNKIQKKSPFTIKGYQLTIKNGKNSTKVYAVSKSVLKSSLEEIVKVFTGNDEYNAYIKDTQKEITTTGSIIENIYFDNDMTIKQMNIPSNYVIYKDEKTLSSYLLYGNESTQTQYTILPGDTIETVAYKNKISPEEFLIYNPQFTSRNNLLFPGQVVTLGTIDPKVNVIVETKDVSDVTSKYKTEERYDENRLVGDDEVLQQGENGLVRVTQKTYHLNGVVLRSEPQNTEELKAPINAIIVRGEKVIPSVGSGAWYWPVNSYSFLRGLEYWIDPDDGVRKAHTGIDIADNCGKPIYAANNGVVYNVDSYYPNGNFVVINHNNGYYTLYAHMSRYIVSKGQVVAKGQIIGYVGQTGQAYGCHLHFEAVAGGPPYRGTFIDARTLY